MNRDSFIGTGALVRLGLRRDRVLLPAWIIAFAAVTGISAAATADLYPDPATRAQAAMTVNASGSLVALYGRIYDPQSLGALSMFKLTAFGSAVLGVLMVFLVIRHTRRDEEAGRLELLGAGVMGHLAPLAAALLIAFGACVLIGVLTSASLAAAGLPLAGALAFGAAWAATGMVFAAFAGICAQLTTGARAAIGLGVAGVGLAYCLRAIGDLAAGDPGWATWASPVGWNEQVRPFAGDRWAVLAIPLLACLVLVPIATALCARRDLGAGLIADRPGPAVGRMGSAFALAWRLQRGALFAWAGAFLTVGYFLGSIADSITGFLDSPTMRQVIIALGGEQRLVDAFLAAEIGLMGTIAAAFGIAAASHLRSEEVGGHAEPILAAAVSRTRWASGHIVIAAGGVTCLLILAGIGIGAGYAVSIGDPEQIPRLAGAALTQVPAALTVAMVVVLLFGWLPRLTLGAWGLLAALVVLGEFGVLWNAPQWILDLSPFVHSPRLPGGDVGWGALAWLCAAALFILLVGMIGWRRRDLQP